MFARALRAAEPAAGGRGRARGRGRSARGRVPRRLVAVAGLALQPRARPRVPLAPLPRRPAAQRAHQRARTAVSLLLASTT